MNGFVVPFVIEGSLDVVLVMAKLRILSSAENDFFEKKIMTKILYLCLCLQQ